jgi:hypothetical protein
MLIIVYKDLNISMQKLKGMHKKYYHSTNCDVHVEELCFFGGPVDLNTNFSVPKSLISSVISLVF